MKVSIDKSIINGCANAPSSKSYTIRGLVCAALSPGESEIINPLSSDDTDAASYALEKIGVRVIHGQNSWRVLGGHLVVPKSDLECRESAATLRFLLAIVSIIPGTIRLTAKPSLVARPITPLLDALHQIGVDCQRESDGKSIVVHGGNINRNIAAVAGDISSQFISALLMLAPLVKGGLNVKLTTPLESRAYIEMTIDCLAHFGIKVVTLPSYTNFFIAQQKYHPTKYTVEGDWSSASYLLASGALAGSVEVSNLDGTSLQGDKALLTFLHEMGIPVSVNTTAFKTRKPDCTLRPITVDLDECIDLLPTMVVMAAFAEGKSEFYGIARARLKESNRVSAITQELKKAGVEIIEEQDRITVLGKKPKGAIFDSHGDHRIAMALSLVGLVCGNTTIENAECVSKTYPEYWQILQSLGGKIIIHGQ
jgi:3-phosphoshikimate 1-carboxyvinyltransferase